MANSKAEAMDRRMMPPRRNWIVLAGLFVLAAVGLFKPWVHGADGMGYYSWLRSVVLDGDLNTANEYEHFGYGWMPEPPQRATRTIHRP